MSHPCQCPITLAATPQHAGVNCLLLGAKAGVASRRKVPPAAIIQETDGNVALQALHGSCSWNAVGLAALAARAKAVALILIAQNRLATKLLLTIPISKSYSLQSQTYHLLCQVDQGPQSLHCDCRHSNQAAVIKRICIDFTHSGSHHATCELSGPVRPRKQALSV